MLTRVEGIIRNGHVELPKDAPAVEGARVMVTFLKDTPSTDSGSNADPLKALESLAEIRRGLPPMDVVEMIQEGREDLARQVSQTLEWTATAIDQHGLVAYWPGATGVVSLTACSGITGVRPLCRRPSASSTRRTSSV